MTDIQILHDGPIVNIAFAIENNLKFYFTGKPCKHGHVDQRKLSNKTCCECMVDTNMRNRESKRDWANRNKEKVYLSNKSSYIKNRDKRIKYAADYRSKNKDKKAIENKLWWSNNRDRARVYNHNRRSLVRGAGGSWSDSDIKELLRTQANKCAEPTCRVDLSDGYHVDHTMPLSKGGSNWPDNLQCLCQRCNLRKSSKHPIDWARENGRLL